MTFLKELLKRVSKEIQEEQERLLTEFHDQLTKTRVPNPYNADQFFIMPSEDNGREDKRRYGKTLRNY